jgi:hypothetical protein
MPTDVLDRARAKCGTRDRKRLGGDREAARWHARLQLSLRWDGLEGQLNKAHEGWESQSAKQLRDSECPRWHGHARTESFIRL